MRDFPPRFVQFGRSERCIHNLDGFDPLADVAIDQSAVSRLVQESQKRDVLNILRSYTGTLDVFSEAIQNAIDACDARARTNEEGYKPKIWIIIDNHANTLRFIDNGIGLTSEEAKYFLRPGMSFKAGKNLRGHKGVGATFLAYGYSSFTVMSKTSGEIIAASLTGGRQWAESTTANIPRPRFSSAEFDVSHLEGAKSGTCLEIVIGAHRDERPNLSWLNISSPEIWLKLLRLRTPLGGVYLGSGGFKPVYSISVIGQSRESEAVESTADDAEYYYPHTFSVCQREADTNEIQKEVAKLGLTKRDIPQKLSMKFRNLDCVWNTWDHTNIIAEDSPFLGDLTEDQRNLIVRHSVSTYGCFVRSRTFWETFQKDELGIRPQFRVIQGGLQLASDFMIQGDLLTIPLTTAAGYQANSFIIVHFTNGNPDMGRKVFQPELKEIADILSRRIVAELRKFQACLKSDTGSQLSNLSKELDEWKDEQKEWSKRSPLLLSFEGRSLNLISKPREEQDVIALFHQLIGMRVIRGLEFYSTGFNTRYDCLYRCRYAVDDRFDSESNFWGVDARSAPGESGALVLEYKYSADSLFRDFDKEEKNPREINLLVCWELGGDYRRSFDVSPYMVGQDGGTRDTFGATHALFVGVGRSTKLFEIIVLSDFLNYFQDPVAEISRQLATYS